MNHETSEQTRVSPEGQEQEKPTRQAEQQLEKSQKDLETNRDAERTLREQVESMRLEKELADSLSKAGIRDLEAGLLLARSRMSDDADAGSVVEQLRRDKAYLFAPPGNTPMPEPTQGIRGRESAGKVSLERSAEQAAQTGSRRDVQEYLKTRRQILGR